MEPDNHSPNARGRAFLWGGIALGLLLVAALATDGFGLLRGGPNGAEQTPLVVPTDLALNVPSRLVAQRPDVRQAAANLHVASAEVGVALANMLPQFAITADAGSAALKLGQLFSPYTGFWDLGASLTQTLFDSGALLHRRRAADAALDQAAAQYRAAVILACQNVADTFRYADTAGLFQALGGGWWNRPAGNSP